jgi:hypothetical protein
VTAYSDVAFKSAEIEELSDVYFFRPLGWFVARAAHKVALTPMALTIVGMSIGIAGGALLFDRRLGLVAFGVLILHSIVDSADGQLARMSGLVSDFGRVLDGLSGYATHAAIFVAITSGLIHRGAGDAVIFWAALAAMATAIHAGMYDYYRNAFTAVVAETRIPGHAVSKMPGPIGWLFGLYVVIQRWLVGSHAKVEAALAARAVSLRISNEERQRYREFFYWLVRGWNFLGDNTRFFAIGILALIHRLDLFFAFILVPMNLVFVVLWLWQRSADRRFLAGLSSSKMPVG